MNRFQNFSRDKLSKLFFVSQIRSRIYSYVAANKLRRWKQTEDEKQ